MHSIILTSLILPLQIFSGRFVQDCLNVFHKCFVPWDLYVSYIFDVYMCQCLVVPIFVSYNLYDLLQLSCQHQLLMLFVWCILPFIYIDSLSEINNPQQVTPSMLFCLIMYLNEIFFNYGLINWHWLVLTTLFKILLSHAFCC